MKFKKHYGEVVVCIKSKPNFKVDLFMSHFKCISLMIECSEMGNMLCHLMVKQRFNLDATLDDFTIYCNT